MVVVQTGATYIVASHDVGKTFDPPHLYDTPDLLTGVEIAKVEARRLVRDVRVDHRRRRQVPCQHGLGGDLAGRDRH